MHQVFRMRADTAQQAEYALNKKRRFGELAFDEMREVVQMRNVVALELEARAVRAARSQDELDVLERILEDQVAAVGEVLALPVVLEVLEPVEHGIQAEVHRAHVQRRYFRLEMMGGPKPFFHGHVRTAAA